MNATAALTRVPPELIEVFSLDDPSVVEGPRTHVEYPIRRREVNAKLWEGVKAA